jgi:hypothetical protein
MEDTLSSEFLEILEVTPSNLTIAIYRLAYRKRPGVLLRCRPGGRRDGGFLPPAAGGPAPRIPPR